MPMDPDYPHDRLAFMLSDSAVDVLLTETRLTTELEAMPCEVICLDTEWEKITAQSSENPAIEVTATIWPT